MDLSSGYPWNLANKVAANKKIKNSFKYLGGHKFSWPRILPYHAMASMEMESMEVAVAVESMEFHGNLRNGLDRKQYVVLII